MFQLSGKEVSRLIAQGLLYPDSKPSRSQFVILKRGQNIKYQPYAFTEQGVAMLCGLSFFGEKAKRLHDLA